MFIETGVYQDSIYTKVSSQSAIDYYYNEILILGLYSG